MRIKKAVLCESPFTSACTGSEALLQGGLCGHCACDDEFRIFRRGSFFMTASEAKYGTVRSADSDGSLGYGRIRKRCGKMASATRRRAEAF